MAGLTGLETLQVLGQDATGRPAATTEQTTTGAIAALAATEGTSLVETAITTAVGGTLTAAALVGGQIKRSGPTAAFSDATDTALAIIAALPGYIVGETFQVLIKNTTGYVQTITAGTGVTLPADVTVAPFSASLYFVTVNSATAVTFTHRNTGPNSMLDVAFQGSTSGAVVVVATAIAGTNTATIQAATDTFVMRATTDTLTNKTLTAPVINTPTVTDMINQDTVATASAFTAVSTTTLAVVPGLSVALTAGGHYAINGRLFVTSINAGGIIAELTATNSLSLTSANITGINYNTITLNAATNITALSADFANYANTCTLVDFSGSLVVNAGGTINVSAAQHTGNASTTTVGAGSFMSVTRIS